VNQDWVAEELSLSLRVEVGTAEEKSERQTDGERLLA